MEKNFQCNNFRLLSFVHYCSRVSVHTETESGFSRNKPQKRLDLLAVLPLTANYTPTTARHAAALIQMSKQPHRCVPTASGRGRLWVRGCCAAVMWSRRRRRSQSCCRRGCCTVRTAPPQPNVGANMVGSRATALTATSVPCK